MNNQFKKFFIGLAKVAFLGYVVYILISQQPIINSKENEKNELEAILNGKQKEEIELRINIESSDSLTYVEEIAKEKLGMLKPGERVFVDIKNKF